MTAADGSLPRRSERDRRNADGWPITILLAVAIGGLVLLSTASIFALQWTVSRTNTLELVNEVSTLVLDHLEEGVRGHLVPAEDQVELVAQQIEAGHYDLREVNALQGLLTGALAGVPQIVAIGTWDSDLQRTLAARPPEGGLVRQLVDDSENAEINAAVEGLRSAEGAFWGELVPGDDGQTLINLRRPLRRHGEWIGFVVSITTVPQFSALVAEIGESFDGTAFVLYGRDRVLAHPNLAVSTPELPEGEVLASINAVGDIVLASLWSGRPVPGIGGVTGSDVHVVDVELGQGRYAVAYREIEGFGAEPWIVGLWLDAESIGQEFHRLIGSAVIGVLLVLLSLGAALLLGRFIARPVRQAALGAARVGELDLDHVEPLRPSLFRELNEQAKAFNAMLASLRAFETYVPKALVRRLMSGGEEPAIGSEERELTVLFTDIVGFTPLSERESAGAVAAFLNEHFALLGACVEAEGGTIDKFIGDALMAFWGAPDRQSDTAQRACRAALAMARALAADNAARAAAGKAPVRVRIGIHTGPVVVGNIGAPGRINYTIVGDTVNTGQRLEALGKTMDDDAEVVILISETTAARLDGSFETRPSGAFEVKGRQERVEVFRLETGATAADA